MTTMELICELRDQATVDEPGTRSNLMYEAADRLESLDERLAIVSADSTASQELLNAILDGLRIIDRRTVWIYWMPLFVLINCIIMLLIR